MVPPEADKFVTTSRKTIDTCMDVPNEMEIEDFTLRDFTDIDLVVTSRPISPRQDSKNDLNEANQQQTI